MSNRPSLRLAASLGLLLLLSLTLNVFLGKLLLDRYDAQLQQQLWPVGPPVAGPKPGTTGTGTNTVLLLGDSRILEWGLPELSGRRVVNAGIGGQTTAQIRLRLSELLAAHPPEGVVIHAGINDLKIPRPHPDWSTALQTQAENNPTAIVPECASRQIPVLLLEIWPPAAPTLLRRPVWSRAIPDSVVALNRRLRALEAPGKRVQVIDLLGLAGVTAGPDTYRDTMHLKPETYRRLTGALEQRLGAPAWIQH
jgi:acyl-CoA thioesterase I